MNLQIPFQTHLAVTLPVWNFPCKNDDAIFSPPCRENDLVMQLPNIPQLETCSITLKEMEEAISNLNANKSSGPDNFHPKLLKLCSKSLTIPFKLLFDNTINEGCMNVIGQL